MRNITVDIVLVTLILAIFVGYFIGINLTVKKYVTDGLKLVEDYTRNEEWAEALKASKDLKELWNKYKYVVMFNFGELDFSDFDHHLNHIIGGLEDQQLDSTLSNILSAKDLWANLEKIVPEPVVYKISSKATVGVFTLVAAAIGLDFLSLKRFFYNIDSRPTIIIAEGKIIEKEFKKVHMSLPLLLSELRVKGYQNISEVKYALIEPSGKLSVIPVSSPVTPKDMGVPASPVNLSFPLIVDGNIDERNLAFLQKDKQWLMDHLKAFNVGRIEEVFLAQYDSTGKLFVNLKNVEMETPNIS